jgi:hypothetical protein
MYPVLRELHLVESDESLEDKILGLVDLLIQDEEGPLAIMAIFAHSSAFSYHVRPQMAERATERRGQPKAWNWRACRRAAWISDWPGGGRQ